MTQYLCPACWRTGAGVAASAPAVVALPQPEPVPVVPEPEPEPAELPAARAEARQPKAKIGPRFWLEHPERPGRGDSLERSERHSRSERPAASPAPAPPAATRGAIATLLDSVLGAADAPATEITTGPVACACGAPLGSEARLDGPPSLLGFGGAPGAGKSVLLLAMLQQLELADPAPFSLAGLGDADPHFRGLRRELFLHGARPAASAASGFGWKIAAAGRAPGGGLRGGRSHYFGFHEAQGTAESQARLTRHLGLVNRLVFVVDGASIARDLGLPADDAWSAEAPPADLGAADLAAFAACCAALGKRTRETALAIVVAKADLLAEAEPWAGLGKDGGLEGAERQDAIRQLLAASCRGNLWTQARQLFRRAGLFAVSGLGFTPRPGDLGEDGRLLRRPAPGRVLAPLEFLLDDVLPRLQARGAGKVS